MFCILLILLNILSNIHLEKIIVKKFNNKQLIFTQMWLERPNCDIYNKIILVNKRCFMITAKIICLYLTKCSQIMIAVAIY